MRTRWLIPLLALALTACDGQEPAAVDETPTQTASSTPSETGEALPSPVEDHGTKDLTASGAAVEMSLELDDRYFKPTFIKVQSGAKIDVELENEGALPHTFTIGSLSIDVELAPNTKKEIVFTLEEDGVTTFACRFHSGEGMQGAFTTT